MAIGKESGIDVPEVINAKSKRRKGAVVTLLFFCNSPFHRSQRKCIDAIIPLEF